MKKNFILLATLSLFITQRAYSHEYIIIKGSNINFRTSPTFSSKIIGTLKENELTFFIQKSEKESEIDDDKYYWYKVKRLNKKTGWVYGKYCYYLDQSRIPEKYYKQILDDLFYNTLTTDGTGLELYNVGFEQIEKQNLIMVKYLSVEPPMSSAIKKYYQISDTNFKLYFETISEAKVIFIDNYIIDLSKQAIFIHKREDKNREFKIVERDNICRDNYKKNFYDSYLEFDEKLMVLSKYYRDTPGKPMRIERYLFNQVKDRFEKIK